MSMFEIKHHLSGAVLSAPELGAEYDDESYSVRCGAAVAMAVKERADLTGANLAYANLAYADLTGANLAGAYMADAYIAGANLTGANLSGANLTGAYLADACLARADLAYADLADADLSYADFSGANLSGADLSGANLSGAKLARADLARANLSGANLSGADLSGANFMRANLSGANLEDADISGVNLAGADLVGAKGISPHRSTPLLMLLDQPGKIRAYKLVDSAGYGPFNGLLRYEVGKSVSVENADTDVTERCGAGINVGTLDWCMREWQPGYRILVVEFTAEDIAAIPIATDGKFRLHRCDVVAEKDLTEIGLVPAAPAEAAE